MKWEDCFIDICNSLYRISVKTSSGIAVGSGFVVAKYKDIGLRKLDFVIATAKHVIGNVKEYETTSWRLEKFDIEGNLQRKIEFQTNIDQTGKSPIRTNINVDIGAIFVPLIDNGENNPVRIIDPNYAIRPGTKVGWAGFPAFTEKILQRPHPCYFEGVISTTFHNDERLYYLIDGHGGQGVSGGPLWCWNDEKENFEIIGICSQYLFPELAKNLPGMVVFESINPLTSYLKSSTEIIMKIIS